MPALGANHTGPTIKPGRGQAKSWWQFWK